MRFREHRGAPALAEILYPEEVAYLAASERCDICEHRKPLHDHENDECNVPDCDCGLRKWKARHEGNGHELTHVPAGTVTLERWNCSCRSSYQIGGG